MQLTDLQKRVIDISYKLKLSHIGSCLTCVDLIGKIYETKEEDDKFILSNGHAHLAHLVVQEFILAGGNSFESEELIEKYGIHCDRKSGCDCSTGSLGQGLPIAVGMALADRSKMVYCMTSDGEWSEGSMWEALQTASDLELDNLWIFVNANGYSAYKKVDIERLEWKIAAFIKGNHPRVSVVKADTSQYPEYLQGLEGHYHVLSDSEYIEIDREVGHSV